MKMQPAFDAKPAARWPAPDVMHANAMVDDRWAGRDTDWSEIRLSLSAGDLGRPASSSLSQAIVIRLQPWTPARPVARPVAVAQVKARLPRLNWTTSVMVVAGGAALAGCQSPPATTTWRIEPLLRTQHAGGVSAVESYAALAVRYEGERRWSLAADAWRKAVVLQPDDPGLRAAQGVALSRAGRHEEAVDALRRAEVITPSDARLLNNLGYALQQAGHGEQAVEKFRLALLFDPGHARARTNLSWAQAQLALKLQPAHDGAQLVASTPVPATAAHELLSVQVKPNAPQLQIGGGPSADMGIKPVGVVAAIAARAAGDEAVPLTVNANRPIEYAPMAIPVAAMGLPRLTVTNGVGVDGAASKVLQQLRTSGLVKQVTLTNLVSYRQAVTVLRYRAGSRQVAQQLAASMPVSVRLEETAALAPSTDVQILLGHDHRPTWLACMSRAGCGSANVAMVMQLATAAGSHAGAPVY